MDRSILRQMPKHQLQPLTRQGNRQLGPRLNPRGQLQQTRDIGQAGGPAKARLARGGGLTQGVQVLLHPVTGQTHLAHQFLIAGCQVRAVFQHLHRRADCRDRRLQLMRDVIGVAADGHFPVLQGFGHLGHVLPHLAQLLRAKALRRGVGLPGAQPHHMSKIRQVGQRAQKQTQKQPPGHQRQRKDHQPDHHRRPAKADPLAQIAKSDQPKTGQNQRSGQRAPQHQPE